MWRAVVAATAGLALASCIYIHARDLGGLPFRSDGFSYYVYLPSWFIFHDPSLAATARDCCGGEFPAWTAVARWPGTRLWVNAHPIGVAVMQAPLFFVAHALTKWTNLPADGFSLYYQHAAGLSGLLATVIGLWVLGRFLCRHFTEPIVAATLIVITFGTNLFHYATFDSLYSHAYSFLLFSALLEVTGRWYDAPNRRMSLLLGAVAGLIILTRHTNALVLILFPLYGLMLRKPFWRHRRWLLEATAVAALVIAPQLAIYYAATGRPLVSSYGDLRFNFASPRIFDVLFSVTKGVFFWSPILLLAVAGLVRLAVTGHSARAFVAPAALFVAVNTYLIASWWDWQFGGSYGHRGFVDSLPLFALGLASAFEWAAARPPAAIGVAVISIAAVSLSVFQMLQYWHGILPFSGVTPDQYRDLFLRWP